MAKKQKKPKKQSKSWELYDLSSGLQRKRKFCLKCGPGFFLAEHNNRTTCGKCGYVEFKGQQQETKQEVTQEKQSDEKPAEDKSEKSEQKENTSEEKTE